MEKYPTLADSLGQKLEKYKHCFVMPAHAGRYISEEFNTILSKYGMH